MSDIPSFGELGKNARDVLRSGYHYGKGLLKLNVKTKSDKALEVDSDFSVNFDANKAYGSMESKYRTKDYGSLSERWITDGTLITEYSLDNKLHYGLSTSAAFLYRAVDSFKGMKLGAAFKNKNFNASTTISNAFDSNVNAVGGLVVGFKDFFIGCQAGYDTESGTVTKNSVSLAFDVGDVGIHLRCINIPYEYGASVFYKVNSEWDAAIDGIYATNADRELWTTGVGARYRIDADSAIRFKFNTDFQLGTSLQQKIRDGIKLTLSFNLDCLNISAGEHKVGLALDLEA